jgi:endonuclease YncB( thermonuclease family)
MVTNRFARSYSFDKRGLSVTAVFAAGFIGGGLVMLTVQSRPAPANPSVPPISAPALHAAPISTLPADVLRVIDGDTFEARVHVWPGLDITTKIRLRGVDAPELKARCPAERSMAEAARDALRDMLAEGAVGVSAIALDKYGGRVVADAGTRSIANVSSELLAKGYARSYAGGRRRGWCDGEATP